MPLPNTSLSYIVAGNKPIAANSQGSGAGLVNAPLVELLANDAFLLQEIENVANSTNTAYITLSDTPSSYSGDSNKFVRVKSSVDGLEHITITPALIGASNAGHNHDTVYEPLGAPNATDSKGVQGRGVFVVNGTFNVPAGITKLLIYMIGGGQNNCGSGGAGLSGLLTVSGTDVLTITIGLGGGTGGDTIMTSSTQGGTIIVPGGGSASSLTTSLGGLSKFISTIGGTPGSGQGGGWAGDGGGASGAGVYGGAGGASVGDGSGWVGVFFGGGAADGEAGANGVVVIEY